MTIWLTVIITFLLFFGFANYFRAESERRARLALEDEASTFTTVLLDHLAEWRKWKERVETVTEALEFIASKPSYPKEASMVEIPGESCQKARDALSKLRSNNGSVV